MSSENLYGLSERHERYTQDTTIFLNELVATSKKAVTAKL